MDDMSELAVDPRSLVVFHLVVEEGSMSGAARRLGWTHPAVSQHVGRLERATGTRLLLRHGRGVRTTAAGAELARAVADLAATLTAATTTVERLRQGGAVTVRVAAFPTACATFLVDTVTALAADAAPVRVELLQAEPPEAVEALRQGRVDLAVVFDDEPSPVPLERTDLVEDELVAVVPDAHPWAALDAVDATRLGGTTLIAGCPTCRRRVREHAGRSGTAVVLHHQDTDDYVLMQAMVAAGQGAAVLPRLALQAHRRPGLAAVPLAPRLTRRLQVCTRTRGSVPDEAARVLDDIVRRTGPEPGPGAR